MRIDGGGVQTIRTVTVSYMDATLPVHLNEKTTKILIQEKLDMPDIIIQYKYIYENLKDVNMIAV